MDVANNMSREEFIELVKAMALEVKPEGEFFTLKSGAQSKYYLDCRRLTLHSVGLYEVVHRVRSVAARALHDRSEPPLDAWGGPCVGADPIVGGLLDRCGKEVAYGFGVPVRGFLVRKEDKDHGKAGRVIGSMRPGDRCVFIEDVTTTGGTSLDAIDAVEAYGGKVVQVVSVIDRLAGAAEAFAARGIPFCSILTIKDLGL